MTVMKWTREIIDIKLTPATSSAYNNINLFYDYKNRNIEPTLILKATN